MPMTISFRSTTTSPRGVEREICVPVDLPTGKMDQGIAACRVEMTVGGETKPIWLRRSLSLDQPSPEVVTFRERPTPSPSTPTASRWASSSSSEDFEVGFEPGTQQPTKFESKVRLTDKAAGIRDEPHTIWMNHPLDHNGYTFYQMRYQPDIDPQTERPTGRFLSVFQVATNPGRSIIYTGCLLVVLGAFFQFYMRAGVFTDGGKKERKRGRSRAPMPQTAGAGRTRAVSEKTSEKACDSRTTQRTAAADRALGGFPMRRFAKQTAGLLLARRWRRRPDGPGGREGRTPGTGPAYDRSARSR